MSYVYHQLNDKIETYKVEQVGPDHHQQHHHQLPVYEIHSLPGNSKSGSSSSASGFAPQRTQTTNQQTMVRTRYSAEDQSSDIVHQISHATEVGAHPNDSTMSADKIEQDSYMGNGADDSANISADGALTDQQASEIDEHDRSSIAEHADFPIKPDGKSYKYPALKEYFEFGPWVGRNRKAICVRCKHQSASSQPERLIKHMKRCTGLNDEDRSIADTLLIESNNNKRGRPSRGGDDDTDYFGDMDDADNSAMTTDQSTNNANSKSLMKLPATKRAKKSGDAADRKRDIDQALARWIMCCRIPLKSIHSKEFVEFVRALDPDYRIPSRETITNVLIPSLLNIL